MRSRNTYSRSIALCGVLAALSVVVMMLGAVIWAAAYIAPMMAAVLVLLAKTECGSRLAWTQYAAVSLLGILFLPDKEVAFVFVFLGCYPLLKPRFDALRPVLLRTGAKLLYFNAAVLVMFALLYRLFFPGQLSAELAGSGLLMAAALLLGNIAFVFFDRALFRLLRVYRYFWQPKLHRVLGIW